MICLSFDHLRTEYQSGTLSPTQVVNTILDRVEAEPENGVWTSVVGREAAIARAEWLEKCSEEQKQALPLWGIPFNVKDCIDVEGASTSCACPGFSYVAEQTNPAVQKLLDAGAIYLGKTNLDQFATGLVGTRTEYPVPVNPFNSDYITGGSSSGAAASVTTGLVSFAIGTDTGGSGRVPAGFNNIVGLKPTRGLLSTAHMVPACRTLDCVSVFALLADDALEVVNIAKGYDPSNPFSRQEPSLAISEKTFQPGQSFRFGTPNPGNLKFFGNQDVEALFAQAIESLTQMGGEQVEIDYDPFLEVNDFLFQGSWAAERYAIVGDFLESHPHSGTPVTRDIILASKNIPAHKAFSEHYRLASLHRQLADLWNDIDIFVVPTTGTAYTLKDIEADPVGPNFNLGYYTNFLNLLDLSAIAVPNGFQPNGVPAGVTIVAPPYREKYLCQIGDTFHKMRVSHLGATSFSLTN